MRLVLGLWTLGLCLLFTGVAEADAPAMPPEPAESAVRALPPIEYDDYRLTLFGVDAASLSLFVLAAFASENEGVSAPFILLGFGGYAIGGPIVHLAHNQPSRALGSLALRVGLPAPGIVMAVALTSRCGSGEDNDLCVFAGAAVGSLFAIGGALAAMIIDDTVLGKAPKVPKSAEPGRTSFFNLGIAPHFEPRRKSAGLSLVGAF